MKTPPSSGKRGPFPEAGLLFGGVSPFFFPVFFLTPVTFPLCAADQSNVFADNDFLFSPDILSSQILQNYGGLFFAHGHFSFFLWDIPFLGFYFDF